MQTRNRNTFTTIHTEGALLPVDLLQRISENDKNLEGLNTESYHLAPGEKLNEAINRSWNRLSGLWGSFQAARGRLGATDAGTTLTRERWLLPLFQELGFGRLSTSKSVEIEGKSYPISHRWQNVPLHLVGCGIELDKRTPGAAGASRTSPHSLMQEYLNRSDDVQWGVISNGLGLRILRDNATLTRQAYIEFDLESMFDGEIYSDFVLLWLMCHQSRFETVEKSTEKQAECLLEKWSKSAQERGTRALDDLRRGVEEAIVSFGHGFLQHPLNGELRNRLKNGALSAQDYYRQLLRLVYRLIFLFAAEDRDLLLLPGAAVEARQRFQNYYSTTRLRALAQRQRGSRHHDRYEALRLVMNLLGSDSGCPELAIPALGGFLFDARSTADLNDARLDNQAFFHAVRSLAFITEGNTRRAVDYRNLGPEELGSVYESLLELHPLLNTDAGTFQLTSAAGNERKTTGSYYTPTSLIRVLLDSALDPVIEDRLRGKQDAAQQEQALLALKVCDPACGSGHFLIAAAHRIAGRLAEVRAADNEPSPNETRRALRDVIRHCIYGVDINPMAVELCKVNLWLESLEPGKPLSFLDAHIQCGDSLVGVIPGLDISEIPDEAFNPAFGDDEATSTALKRRNKRERTGQMGFRWDATMLDASEDQARKLAEQAVRLDAMPEDEADQVNAKVKAFAELQQANEYIQGRLEQDFWTAAFFWEIPKTNAEDYLAPTQQELKLLRSGSKLDQLLINKVSDVAVTNKFFHWQLAFPQVFLGETPGFDCVLGNPPWDQLQFREVEFFAFSYPDIALANSGSLRKKLIDKLKAIDYQSYYKFQASKASVDNIRNFVQVSGRNPTTAVGRINTYALFAESDLAIVNSRGNLGVIIPSGIATDDSTKLFFQKIMENGLLASLYDFENREGIFPNVHSSYKFCLLTAAKANSKLSRSKGAEFVFYAHKVADVNDSGRRFTLTFNEIEKINPNTKTCPILRRLADVDLLRKISNNFPILINENISDGNPWGIVTKPGLFNMTHDSGLFVTTETLKVQGSLLSSCQYLYEKSIYVPLLEAKMVDFFDHRSAGVVISETAQIRQGQPDEFSEVDHKAPDKYPTPRFWVSENDVELSINGQWNHNWLFGWKQVTSPTNERTLIPFISSKVGIGHSLYIALVQDRNPYSSSVLVSLLLANFSSLCLDYITRLKLGGVNMTPFTLKQLPVIPIQVYEKSSADSLVAAIPWILLRTLELVYTAWDMKSFADEIWNYCGSLIENGSQNMRPLIKEQWEKNKIDTGGHEWNPPRWIDLNEHGIPLPPFKWDGNRRSILRAELDAYYARLYDLNRKQLRYILDPAELTPRELENILDPWEEVVDPLDPVGYDTRRNTSNFPGETFRVLKEKEIRQFGEYRTRRLVLEAWDRLEGVEVGNPDGYSAQSTAVSTRRETITVAQSRPESRPAVVQTQLPASAKPSLPVTPPAKVASSSKVIKEIDPPADQPTLTDFGLYKCEVCGKMVMGFEKGNHEQEKHGGKGVEWKKVR